MTGLKTWMFRWDDEHPAEYLYWPGCSGAFDSRNRKVAVAMVKLLKKAGVSFAILGNEEKCCGDSARRLGNELLYQTLANENIETLNSHGVKKIITSCPHCFNTLKNEYPQFGGNFEVIHHSVFLSKLLKENKLKPNDATDLTKEIVCTYHDSCYLGRYNGIYDGKEILRGSRNRARRWQKTDTRASLWCWWRENGRKKADKGSISGTERLDREA